MKKLGSLILIFVLFVSILGVSGCQSPNLPGATMPPTQVVEATVVPQETGMETRLPAPVTPLYSIPPSQAPTETVRPTATPTPTRTPTLTPSPTATPDPLSFYTIAYLRERSYGGGAYWSEVILGDNSYFTRREFIYDSDGLEIHGFINVPKGIGPFPVVIALHGYIDPAIYQTLDYTTRYADTLARAGFLVIHPNLRNYPPSDTGDNLFRVGMAVDVLNLIAIVRDGAGLPGVLENANPDQIGLWGHSMGGGISTRVVTISPYVRAAVLYAAMSGDERQNYEAISEWSDGERGQDELAVQLAYLEQISPVYHFDGITAAISIHHGRQDALVPLGWSRQTCDTLVQLGISVECVFYDGMPHTFYGEKDLEFEQNVIRFYRKVFSTP